MATFPKYWLLLVLSLGSLVTHISAAEPVSKGPITLEATEQYVIRSENIGQDFRLDIGLPPGYQTSDKAYPVVYMTDSNAMFAFVRGNTISLQETTELPQFILVGIGYESPGYYDFLHLRNRDLTPTYDLAWTESQREVPPPYGMPDNLQTGGASDFLQFINDEIKPFIYATFRADSTNETLVGYSLGGLFSSYVLFNSSDSFDNYVISSPGLQWNDSVSFKYETTYASQHDDMDKNVFLSAESLAYRETMVSNVLLLNERLSSRNYPNLKLSLQIFEGETHISGMGAAVNRGLLSVLSSK